MTIGSSPTACTRTTAATTIRWSIGLVPNINNLDHWGVSATLEWRLSDTFSLKSITAYRDWSNEFGRDSDGTPLPNNATYDESKHRQFTQEFQLTGTAGKLDWAAGAFYYDAHDSNQRLRFPATRRSSTRTMRLTGRTPRTGRSSRRARSTSPTSSRSRSAAATPTTRRTRPSTGRISSVASSIDNAFVPLSTTNTDYTIVARLRSGPMT